MTLDQAEKIFNRMVASVNNVIKKVVWRIKGDTSDYANLELTDLMFKTIAGEANNNNHLQVAAGQKIVAGQIYYVENGPAPLYIYAKKTATVNLTGITLNTDNVNFIALNSYFAEYLSTEVATVNRAIELVQEAQIYATNGSLFQNKFADKVLNYSAKVDKWLGENFNHALQPTLFAIHSAKEGNKILQTIETVDAKLNRVSGIPGAPLKVSSESPVILKPTSYTLETFCPIMAKFVTISKIDGVDQTAAQAEALSIESENGRTAKFGHVISSYYDQYVFQPEAGKTYTILYEAVDFFGNTFKKEYYIKGE
jgi:hypothetical protein